MLAVVILHSLYNYLVKTAIGVEVTKFLQSTERFEHFAGAVERALAVAIMNPGETAVGQLQFTESRHDFIVRFRAIVVVEQLV